MTSPTPASKAALAKFQKTIWDYYRQNRRSFPWRELDWEDPASEYLIAVSEIMLQQTQAPRVVSKYLSFIKKFPSWEALARAPFSAILAEWKGLGYNRRALNLQKLAQAILSDHAGHLPRTAEQLIDLPSIGPNTAGSILAFAFNTPHPFIETNIRSVYIHFFFSEKFSPKKSTSRKQKAAIQKTVHDKDILALVEKTLDTANPREWYYALMDYGVMLKAEAKLSKTADPSRKSRHYVKQSSFKGSNREVRSLILSRIMKSDATQSQIITDVIQAKNKYRTKENIIKNIATLEKEGFIQKKKSDTQSDVAFCVADNS